MLRQEVMAVRLHKRATDVTKRVFSQKRSTFDQSQICID